MEEVKCVIKALLCTEPEPIPATKLNYSYKDSEGADIPFREFGCNTLIDFLKAHCSDIVVPSYRNGQCFIAAKRSADTAHIQTLVTQQKPKNKRLPLRRPSFRNMHFPERNFGSNPADRLNWRNPNNYRHNYPVWRPPLNDSSRDPVTPSRIYGSPAMRVSNNSIPKQQVYMNIKDILSKYPNGLTTQEIDEQYMTRFKTSVPYREYGFLEMYSFVAAQTELFKSVRASNGVVRLLNLGVLPTTSSGPGSGAENTKVPSIVTQKFTPKLDVLDKISPPAKTLSSQAIAASDNEAACSSKATEIRNDIPESVIENLKKLFGSGSAINLSDIRSEYQSKYSVTLDPVSYGFTSLLDMLNSRPDVFQLQSTPVSGLIIVRMVSLDDYSVKQISSDLYMAQVPYTRCLPLDEPTAEESALFSVVVTHVYAPNHFYMGRSYYATENKLNALMDALEDFYLSDQANNLRISSMEELLPGTVCAVPYPPDSGQEWHRGVVLPRGDHNLPECFDVFYCDYGTSYKNVSLEHVRKLPARFSELPAQAMPAKLHGIVPKDGATEWSKEACNFLLNISVDRDFICQFVGRDESDGKYAVLLVDTSQDDQDFHVVDELLSSGFADAVCTEEQLETTVTSCSAPSGNIKHYDDRSDKQFDEELRNYLDYRTRGDGISSSSYSSSSFSSDEDDDNVLDKSKTSKFLELLESFIEGAPSAAASCSAAVPRVGTVDFPSGRQIFVVKYGELTLVPMSCVAALLDWSTVHLEHELAQKGITFSNMVRIRRGDEAKLFEEMENANVPGSEGLFMSLCNTENALDIVRLFGSSVPGVRSELVRILRDFNADELWSTLTTAQ